MDNHQWIDRKSLAFVTNSKYRYILRHTPWRAGLRGKCCHKQQGKGQDFHNPMIQRFEILPLREDSYCCGGVGFFRTGFSPEAGAGIAAAGLEGSLVAGAATEVPPPSE